MISHGLKIKVWTKKHKSRKHREERGWDRQKPQAVPLHVRPRKSNNSRGPDGVRVRDKHRNLGHVQMCRPVTCQRHLHGQKEVPRPEQGPAQRDFSTVSVLPHAKVSVHVAGDYAERHYVSHHRIGGSHPKNVCGDRCVVGKADVVEGDPQRQWETGRRVLRELASDAIATAGMVGIKWNAECWTGQET